MPPTPRCSVRGQDRGYPRTLLELERRFGSKEVRTDYPAGNESQEGTCLLYSGTRQGRPGAVSVATAKGSSREITRGPSRLGGSGSEGFFFRTGNEDAVGYNWIGRFMFRQAVVLHRRVHGIGSRSGEDVWTQHMLASHLLWEQWAGAHFSAPVIQWLQPNRDLKA